MHIHSQIEKFRAKFFTYVSLSIQKQIVKLMAYFGISVAIANSNRLANRGNDDDYSKTHSLRSLW